MRDANKEAPHIRLFDGRRVKVNIQWEPRDLWVGLFWRVNRHDGYNIWHFYLCILPMIPIHVTVLRAGKFSLGQAWVTRVTNEEE